MEMRAKGKARLAPVLAAVALACGDATGPAEPNRYRSDHFAVVDSARLEPAAVDAFLAGLERDYGLVAGFLPAFEPPDSIVAYIRPGSGLPYMTIGIWELAQWAGRLAPDYNVHLLIHIFTGYEKSDFLEEGIAVYGTEVLVPESRTVDPYRAQAPHAWVSLFAQHETLIPLPTAWSTRDQFYDPRGSTADAAAWQFFIEAGSFTRWVIDEYGRATWDILFTGANPFALLGFDLATLETQWVAAAQSLHPDPSPCAEVVGEVGPREEFWCARAEGG